MAKKPPSPDWRNMHPDWLTLCNAERELEAAKAKRDKARAKWGNANVKEMSTQAAEKVVWHKGPPPSIGWWPASTTRNREVLRWWDGARWSVSCTERTPFSSVAFNASTPTIQMPGNIEWADRPLWWPERSKT